MCETENPMASKAHTAAETSARMTHTSWRHTLPQPRLFVYNPVMSRTFQRLLVAAVLFAAAACSGDPARSQSTLQQAESSPKTATHSGSPDIDLAAVDNSVVPGDDF